MILASTFTTGVTVLLVVYALVVLFFVVKGAIKIKNISDYAVGNILFSPYAVGLSLAAAMTSAATFVINPGFIANFGISGVLSYGIVLPIAATISLIVLTKSFRKHGQTVKALSLAQWIGTRYHSRNYSFFMALLSMLLITFIVLIVVAIVSVIATALDANPIFVLTGLVVFVFGYMMYGGANSMVYTNTLQALVMLVVGFILLFSGLEHFSEGIGGFFRKLADIDPLLAQPVNPESPLFRDYYEIIFAQLVIGIAIVVQPHIITKSLLLKKESDVNKFLFTAVTVELIFFFVVFAGLYARLAFPDLTLDGVPLRNDQIIPTYVVWLFSDTGVGAFVGLLVVLGLISAGMSTLEGLIQSVSTSITSDIVKPLVNKGMLKDHQLIFANKIAIVGLAMVTWVIARDQILNPNLSVAILAQNGVYAYFSAAFIPVIFGIFFKNIRTFIPFTASITAIVVHFTVYYGMGIMVESWGLDLGFFTKFVVGTVKNPAIAASTAIVVSTVVALVLMVFDKNKIQQS
ncbi:MAG: sodium:solute symporter [Bacteroidetes bacterium]|nr:MAG: sodium:solute symporter [Bacteroidota bacterium]